MKTIILIALLIVGSHLCFAAVSVTNANTSLTNWKPVCILPSCNPGGTNIPQSTSQTTGNASPSISGNSMQFSETTLSSATTQTNALWVYLAGSCDGCRTLISDFSLYLSPNVTANDNIELDIFNFDVTDNTDFMFGMQCNLTTGQWQIANQTSAWSNAGVACSLSNSTWHHIQQFVHCTNTTEFFDSITVDGTNFPINLTLPTTTLTPGWASTTGFQRQLDIGAQSGTTTATIFTDNENFQATATTSPTVLNNGSIHGGSIH